MDFSTKISERMWNLPDKGELEAEREKTFIDDIVQKAHIEKELLQSLDGIENAKSLVAVANMKSSSEILEYLGVVFRNSNVIRFIKPLIIIGLLERTISDAPLA